MKKTQNTKQRTEEVKYGNVNLERFACYISEEATPMSLPLHNVPNRPNVREGTNESLP